MNQLKQLAVMIDRTELLKNSSEKLRKLTKVRSKYAPGPVIIKIGTGSAYKNIIDKLSYDELCKLAKAYGVRIDDLLHRFSSVLIAGTMIIKKRIKKVYKKYKDNYNPNYKYQKPIGKTIKFGSFVFLV